MSGLPQTFRDEAVRQIFYRNTQTGRAVRVDLSMGPSLEAGYTWTRDLETQKARPARWYHLEKLTPLEVLAEMAE